MSVNGAKMPRLGSARLGSAAVLHLLLSVSSSNSIKSSDKIRKLGELCPVFGFFLLWEGGLLLKLYA